MLKFSGWVIVIWWQWRVESFIKQYIRDFVEDSQLAVIECIFVYCEIEHKIKVLGQENIFKLLTNKGKDENGS